MSTKEHTCPKCLKVFNKASNLTRHLNNIKNPCKDISGNTQLERNDSATPFTIVFSGVSPELLMNKLWLLLGQDRILLYKQDYKPYTNVINTAPTVPAPNEPPTLKESNEAPNEPPTLKESNEAPNEPPAYVEPLYTLPETNLNLTKEHNKILYDFIVNTQQQEQANNLKDFILNDEHFPDYFDGHIEIINYVKEQSIEPTVDKFLEQRVQNSLFERPRHYASVIEDGFLQGLMKRNKETLKYKATDIIVSSIMKRLFLQKDDIKLYAIDEKELYRWEDNNVSWRFIGDKYLSKRDKQQLTRFTNKPKLHLKVKVKNEWKLMKHGEFIKEAMKYIANILSDFNKRNNHKKYRIIDDEIIPTILSNEKEFNRLMMYWCCNKLDIEDEAPNEASSK
jgi:hypothetical protein